MKKFEKLREFVEVITLKRFRTKKKNYEDLLIDRIQVQEMRG